jgi:hypothetical protein
LVPEPEQKNDEAATVAGRLLGHVASLEPIGGGRNSRVYRVAGSDGRLYALKAYFRRATESRDRLEVEFAALEFLWRQGFRGVPEPMAADRAAGYALYAYVEGQRLSPGAISADDVDAAADFLARLKRLSAAAERETLPRAAEACFSGRELFDNLMFRQDRLARQAADGTALQEFLDGQWTPALARVASWSRGHMDWDQPLPTAHRTLSPSDFGFHNALRRAGGAWVFLDFEYFGWDDPAKMIADFLLHPAMELSAALGRRFVERLRPAFAEDRSLAVRLKYLYPMFGLKWCLILLNEFLPADNLRRQFAAGGGGDRAAVQAEQLAKARRMLAQAAGDYEHLDRFD